jgi:DNA-binding transcriptional LysR family regulator
MNNYDDFILYKRTMDLSDLRIFRAVVEHGGITRAAERLHRVQSNVTTRIKQLEDELGTKLFIRAGKKLHISPAGQVLLGYAGKLLDLAGEARDALQDTSPRGLLRLGAMESTAAVRLPAPLSAYHKRYPEVTLELRTGNTVGLAGLVLTGELDAALVAEPVADAPFEKIAVYDEELVMIARAGHKPIRSAGDLEPATMLSFETGTGHRNDLVSHHPGLRGGGHGRFGHSQNRPEHVPGAQAPQRAQAAQGPRSRPDRAALAQRGGIVENPRPGGGSDGPATRRGLGPEPEKAARYTCLQPYDTLINSARPRRPGPVRSGFRFHLLLFISDLDGSRGTGSRP